MEYRIAKGWQITAVVLGLLFIAGGAALALSPFYADNMRNQPGLLIILGLAIAGLGAVVWLDTIKTLLTINDTSVTLQGAFGRRSLQLDDIKGYRTVKNYVYLLSKSGAKPIRISEYMGGLNNLKEWIQGKYNDVDAVAIEEETKEILANEEFGFSKEDREALLKKAKTTSRIANGITGALIGWLLVYPHPYQLVWVLVLILPAVGLYILWHFKGLVTVNDGTKSAYPSMQFLFFMSGIMAVARALIDYDIYQYNKLWTLVIIIALILTGLVYIIAYTGPQKNINKKPVIFGLMAIFACYGYGFSVFVNCHFDNSNPQVFTVPVTDKHISSGKTTTYYLTAAPWGKYNEPDDISVPKSLYETVQTGDSVHIYLRDGKLGVSWFFVDKE